jgi:sugar lactone lactonase YvrE
VNHPGIISTHLNILPAYSGSPPGTTQPISFPGAIAAARDSGGGFYFTSPGQNRVFRVLRDGSMSLIAGSPQGLPGDAGDGGPASSSLLRYPMGVAVDDAGNVFISDTGNGRIRKINSAGVITSLPFRFPSARSLAIDSGDNLYVADVGLYQIYKITPDGSVTTAAGNGTNGFSGDGGPATSAQFTSIAGIAIDADDNLLLADMTNNRIRIVTRAGIIRTIAGNGDPGYTGDGGPAVFASLNFPRGVAVDAGGNIYIADDNNHVIRRVAPGGIIATIAGRHPSGYGGDNAAADLAQLRNPRAVAAGADGTIYIADANNQRIRAVTPQGIILTVAGVGGAGSVTVMPRNLAIDAAGNLYATGLARHYVHKITPEGLATPFAGNGSWGFSGDGGPAFRAQLREPAGLSVDHSGNVYIADSGNHRIRKVSPDGTITTVAGDGSRDFSGDGGSATAAGLRYPNSVALDSSGALYIVDTDNYRIRKVNSAGIISTIAGNGSTGPPADGIAISLPLGRIAYALVDRSGSIFLTDAHNQLIRKLTPDGQIRKVASMLSPSAMAMDDSGNLYVSDTNTQVVWKLTPSGDLRTIAGSGRVGFSGDGDDATEASMYAPVGLALGPDGVLYIADHFNGVIRKVPLTASVTYSIADSAAVSMRTPGAGEAATSGFGKVNLYRGSTAPEGIAIFEYRKDNILLSQAGVQASEPIRSGRIQVELREGIRTGVAMANPNIQAADVTFAFSYASGNPSSGSLTIPAGGHITAFLNEPPFNGDGDGTFTFSATVPIGVIALRGHVNERADFLITTMPIVNLDSPPASGAAWIPHFADGAGWTTQVNLVNPIDFTISGTLQFRDSAGILVSSATYSIPPRGAVTLPARGPDSGRGSIGIISADAGVLPSATAVFSYTRSGVTVAESGVASVPPGNSFRLLAQSSGDFARAAAGSIQTGIAVVNTTGDAASVSISIEGRTAGLTIPANGHTAIFLDQIPGLEIPSQYRGVVQVQSTSPISVIGLRGRYNERGDFLIATIPPVPESTSAVAPLFPYYVDGGGYTTEFVLYRRRNAHTAGFLTFH